MQQSNLLPAVLEAVSHELSQAAALAGQLQDTLHLGTTATQDMQALDLLTQTLSGLDSFIQALACMAPMVTVPLERLTSGLALSGLATRLGGGTAEPVDHGAMELFGD